MLTLITFPITYQYDLLYTGTRIQVFQATVRHYKTFLLSVLGAQLGFNDTVLALSLLSPPFVMAVPFPGCRKHGSIPWL